MAKIGLPQQLALFFFKDILKRTSDPWKTPEFWRYVKESKFLLERGYKFEIIQDTIRAMVDEGMEVTTLWAIEWKKGNVTYYEYCADPMLSMPPIYTLDYKWWKEKHDKIRQ